jgi:hypothetical protein
MEGGLNAFNSRAPPQHNGTDVVSTSRHRKTNYSDLSINNDKVKWGTTCFVVANLDTGLVV